MLCCLLQNILVGSSSPSSFSESDRKWVNLDAPLLFPEFMGPRFSLQLIQRSWRDDLPHMPLYIAAVLTEHPHHEGCSMFPTITR
jgi:hypothetical protein